jgi:hypothetical protein
VFFFRWYSGFGFGGHIRRPDRVQFDRLRGRGIGGRFIATAFRREQRLVALLSGGGERLGQLRLCRLQSGFIGRRYCIARVVESLLGCSKRRGQSLCGRSTSRRDVRMFRHGIRVEDDGRVAGDHGVTRRSESGQRIVELLRVAGDLCRMRSCCRCQGHRLCCGGCFIGGGKIGVDRDDRRVKCRVNGIDRRLQCLIGRCQGVVIFLVGAFDLPVVFGLRQRDGFVENLPGCGEVAVKGRVDRRLCIGQFGIGSRCVLFELGIGCSDRCVVFGLRSVDRRVELVIGSGDRRIVVGLCQGVRGCNRLADLIGNSGQMLQVFKQLLLGCR